MEPIYIVELTNRISGRLSIEHFTTIAEAQIYIKKELVPIMEPGDSIIMYEDEE